MTASFPSRCPAAVAALALSTLLNVPCVAAQADLPAQGIYGLTVNNGTSADRPAGSFDVRLPYYNNMVPGTNCRTPIVTRLSDDPDGAMQMMLRKASLYQGITLRVTDDRGRNVVPGLCSLVAVGRPTQP